MFEYLFWSSVCWCNLLVFFRGAFLFVIPFAGAFCGGTFCCTFSYIHAGGGTFGGAFVGAHSLVPHFASISFAAAFLFVLWLVLFWCFFSLKHLL